MNIWHQEIPPGTAEEEDWVVRLDGRCAAGCIEGGVEGGSAGSVELWTIGWVISLSSTTPSGVDASLSVLLLDRTVFDFTKGATDTW